MANNTSEKTSSYSLTKIIKIKKKLISAELSLWLTTLSATKADLLQVNFYAMKHDVLENYDSFISRTTGKEREGMFTWERRSKSSNVVENAPGELPAPKKSGFFSLRRS